VDCLICEEAILEPSDTCVGDEAVFCEGSCQGWLHRKCASVAFDKLGEQDTEYICSYCMLESQGKEISKLLNVIQDLNTAIVSLTETIQLLQSSVSKQSPTPDQPSNTTADIASAKQTFQEKPQQDQKFNVVIQSSIDGCPNGTPRHKRSGLDLSSVTQIITKVYENINPLSICDFHRLGKYQEKSRHPQPILTRFNKVIDISLLLSKSSSFHIGIRIKPNMTPDE